MKSAIVRVLKKSRTNENDYGYWDEGATLKTRKDASFEEVRDEVMQRNQVGQQCSHGHDCCGCVSRGLDSLKRIKRGEYRVVIHCSRNI